MMKCPICFGNYSSGNVAKVMLCGHTFCSRCINRTRHELGNTCPTCKRKVHKSEAAHTNFALMEVIDEEATKRASAPPPCICASNLQVSLFCTTCCEFVCTSCIETARHHDAHSLISSKCGLAHTQTVVADLCAQLAKFSERAKTELEQEDERVALVLGSLDDMESSAKQHFDTVMMMCRTELNACLKDISTYRVAVKSKSSERLFRIETADTIRTGIHTINHVSQAVEFLTVHHKLQASIDSLVRFEAMAERLMESSAFELPSITIIGFSEPKLFDLYLPERPGAPTNPASSPILKDSSS